MRDKAAGRRLPRQQIDKESSDHVRKTPKNQFAKCSLISTSCVGEEPHSRSCCRSLEWSTLIKSPVSFLVEDTIFRVNVLSAPLSTKMLQHLKYCHISNGMFRKDAVDKKLSFLLVPLALSDALHLIVETIILKQTTEVKYNGRHRRRDEHETH